MNSEDLRILVAVKVGMRNRLSRIGNLCENNEDGVVAIAEVGWWYVTTSSFIASDRIMP